MGLAAAVAIGAEGAKIVVNSRKKDNVEAAVKAIKEGGCEHVMGLIAHGATKEGINQVIESTVSAYGKVDILVLNHAVSPGQGTLLDYPEEKYDKIMDVNVKSYWLWLKHCVPKMNDNGSIVMNASMGGFTPGGGLPIYGMSKTAVMGLVKAAASELGPTRGIRVNGICPGIIMTRFAGELWKDEKQRKRDSMNYHLRRLGTPQDIGGVVAFLCSDEAAYITGDNFQIAGGAMIGSRL
eukprot:gnl/TRDRNA2_/TRDRNA2_199873_c0_seq1.p1 gnl/TRDRNA2_/TRDRNA2_199873_c0~~gnl/TRDRNA2_/TRDRNA2_199873_c0_seq1.p1  ORF type:complete len:246 (+),score=43.31 gnl/TRDRNA2_/TRDRNA2_199873_c0_seq1:25-738(+)